MSFKNGTTRKEGYVLEWAPNHPFVSANGYVPQHRLIMERHLGKILGPSLVVHHINHVRDDNRLENLKVMEVGEHHSLHTTRFFVTLDGERLGYCEAAYLLGISRGSLDYLRKQSKLTHQGAVDFYVKKRRAKA